MHQANISQVVYRHLYPRPRQNDPSSFSSHVTRNLVPEVRVETATFYGALDCLEAQYPGLNYTYPPHRRRLGRFPWHRRLFRAFDELGLTDSEILSICQWEGTKSAKDKYERDAGQIIVDTTLDDIPLATPPGSPKAEFYTPSPLLQAEGTRTTQIIEDVMRHTSHGSMYNDLDDSAEEESDMEDMATLPRIESIGDELNRQLRAAAEARMRGDNVVLDEQWEQWLKEALERNGAPSESLRARFQQNYENTVSRFSTPGSASFDSSRHLMAAATAAAAVAASSSRSSGLTDDDTLNNPVTAGAVNVNMTPTAAPSGTSQC